MSVILIVAMSLNRVIGKGNEIPWNIPEEQQLFKKITIGHTLIMGRKTYESIGRPLPERKNIIITRNKHFTSEGCHIYPSLKQAIEDHKNTRIFIIGGAEIFRQTLAIADEIYLTVIQEEIEGDVFFPEFPENDYRIKDRKFFDREISFELIHYVKSI